MPEWRGLWRQAQFQPARPAGHDAQYAQRHMAQLGQHFFLDVVMAWECVSNNAAPGHREEGR